MKSRGDDEFNAAARQALADAQGIPLTQVTEGQLADFRRQIEKISDTDEAVRMTKAKRAETERLFSSLRKR